MARRLSKDEWIAKFRSIHKNKYDYSSSEFSNETKRGIYTREISIICDTHGLFKQQKSKHANGQGCPKCGNIKKAFSRSQNAKLDNHKFISECNIKHDHKYDYSLLNKISLSSKISILCPHHGSSKIIAHEHLSGKGCYKCSQQDVRMNKLCSFISRAKKLHHNKYSYRNITYYRNQDDKVKIGCYDHGLFLRSPYNHLLGQGCPKCGVISANTKRRFKKVKEDYSNILHYENTRQHLNITCPDHGSSQQPAEKHLIGHGCPKCSMAGCSKVEKELVTFIQSFYPNSLLENDRNLIYPKELDIVIPHLKLAIEFNVLYWHSNDKSRHSDKTIACNKIGYRLIHIFEDDWYHKPDIIKNYLKYQLGYDDRLKVSARKCSIRTISIQESKEFLSKYHIQSSVRMACYRIGLIHDDTIVAVIVCKQDNNDLNISRYATSCNVRGGFSKLLKYIMTHYPSQSIVTFADKICSEGDLYENTGFKIDYEIKPDYKYIIDGVREHKFKWRHTSGLPSLSTYNKNLTEFQNMDLAGIPRIYDAGKIKYRMNIST